MSDIPQPRHDADARPDDGAPTDAVTDEVRVAGANAEDGRPDNGSQDSDAEGDA